MTQRPRFFRLAAALAALVAVLVIPTSPTARPANAAVSDGWANIDVGDAHTCGVTTVGEAFCWGRDNENQLGGAAAGAAPAEVPAIAGVTWASIDTGSYFTCAVTTDGDIYCWGIGTWGQIGNGDAPPVDFYPTPQLVERPVGVTWADVSAGYGHTCALTTDGDLYCWGRNAQGQLGVGDEIDRSAPALVPRQGGMVWAQVDAGVPEGNNFGGETTCALNAAGNAFCWGDDRDGELGNDLALTDSNVPVPVVDIGQPWASIRVGLHHTCGVGRDGAGWCWGNNASLQLGLGAGALVNIAPVPESVVTPVGVEWAVIDAGSFVTCGVTLDGAMYCWGSENFNLLLGDGNTTPDQYPEPNLVVTEPGVLWADVEVSWSHACAFDTMRTGWCWGSDSHGVLGNGGAVNIDQPQPTVVGERTGGPQAIVFLPENDKLTTDPPFNVSPDAESGLPVSVAAVGACMIEFDRLVTLTGPGTCSLTATQLGNADWLPALPVTQSFLVTAPLAMPPLFSGEFLPASILALDDTQLVITIDNSANSAPATDLAFTSDPFDGVTMTGPSVNTCGGTVTLDLNAPALAGGFVAAGESCTITIDIGTTVHGGYLYESENLSSGLGLSGAITTGLTVAFAPQTISVVPISVTPLSQGTLRPIATATSGGVVEVVGTGACTSPDSVDVVLTSVGTCTLDLFQSGNATYGPANATVEFEVVRPRPQFQVIGPMAPTLVGMPAEFSVDLDIGVLTDATGTVRFTAASGQTADVVLVAGLASWVVSDLPVGTTVVTAEYLGDANYAPGSASVDATHEVITAPLGLTGLPATVDAGDSVTVMAAGFHAGEVVEFVFNSDPVVVGAATSSATGEVTLTFTIPAVDPGSHTLTATGATSQLVASAETTLQAVVSTTTPATTVTTLPQSVPTPPLVPDMGDELPATGRSVSDVVWWALVLLVIGGGASLVARRRQPHRRLSA